jgi:2-dehydro-3-deoxygluconokinase
MRGFASIGECMLELSGKDTSWTMGHAGDTFNTLWAMRALLPHEQSADFISAFGDDPFSHQQLAFFAEHDIGVGASPRIAGARPGLYAITLNGAERSFTYWRADAAARKLADDPDQLAKSLKDRELIYFSGITLAILQEGARRTLLDAIAEARAAGSTIAFDPNYRPRLWNSPGDATSAMANALAITDIALPTFPDEEMLFGDARPAATAERINGFGVKEIVVKDGSEPALVTAGGASETVPAVHVAAPVDTTGAGDSFNGAYLAARLLGHEPAEAARRAHQVAAAVVQVRGALAPFATLRSAFSG